MFFWLIFLFIKIPPIGSHPETWERYNLSINIEKQTFECFDGSKIISLKSLNDNYLDCSDGSDEPGTSAFPNGTFFCKNDGIASQIIPKWSIGDGICDCDDGSDEVLEFGENKCNEHVKEIQSKKKEISLLLQEEIAAGIKESRKLQMNANVTIKKAETISKIIKATLTVIDKVYNFLPNTFSSASSVDNLSKWQEYVVKIWKKTFPTTKQRKLLVKELVISIKSDLKHFHDKLTPYFANYSKTISFEKNPGLIALENQKFKYEQFEIEFFKKVTQYNSIVLGYFTNITDNIAYFDDGEFCDIKNDYRSISIEILCGKETKLVYIKEPTVCSYKGYFISPAGCNENSLDEIHRKSLYSLKQLYDLYQ